MDHGDHLVFNLIFSKLQHKLYLLFFLLLTVQYDIGSESEEEEEDGDGKSDNNKKKTTPPPLTFNL